MLSINDSDAASMVVLTKTLLSHFTVSSNKTCHSHKSVNYIEGFVAHLSPALAKPTPKIIEIIIQNEVLQREATIIANSISVADVRPMSFSLLWVCPFF